MENLRPNRQSGLYFLYKQHNLDKKLREMKAPYPNVDFAIVDMGQSLAIMLKEEQIMVLSGEQQVSVMEWVQRMRSTVELHGIRCDIVGRKAKE